MKCSEKVVFREWLTQILTQIYVQNGVRMVKMVLEKVPKNLDFKGTVLIWLGSHSAWVRFPSPAFLMLKLIKE